MTTNKNAVLLDYNLKIYLMQGEKGDFWWEAVFLGGKGMSKLFGWWGEDSPHPPVGKTQISTLV